MERVQVGVAMIRGHYRALCVLGLILEAVRGSLVTGQRVGLFKVYRYVPGLVQFDGSTVAAAHGSRGVSHPQQIVATNARVVDVAESLRDALDALLQGRINSPGLRYGFVPVLRKEEMKREKSKSPLNQVKCVC